MADYYPLIAKAVAGLDRNTGDARRMLYERARTALVTQLRGVSPALGESDITRERLALEEAIRKVEAEAARNARFDPPEPRRIDREPSPAPRPEPRPEPPPVAQAAPAETPDEQPPPPPPADPPISGTAAELRRSARGKGGSLSDQGLRGFRDVVAEADHLGEATLQAGRSAREAYNSVPSDNPEAERLEPRMEPEGLRPRARSAESPLSRSDPPRREPRPDITPGPPARDMRGGAPSPPIETSRQAAVPPPAPTDFDMPGSIEPDMRDDNFPARDFGRDERHGHELEPPVEPSVAPRPAGRAGREPRPRPTGSNTSSRRYILMTVALLFVAGIGGLIAWQWPVLTELAGIVWAPKPAVTTAPPKEAAPASKKIPDRVGSDQLAPSSVPGVAQRVVLYEEDPADPAGKRYVGSAVWRTETVSPGAGLAPEMAVRADIEIPERKMTMRWSLRRNTDKALPASHTVEIMFTLPPDFPNQGIQNIPGILMKQAEQTRGVPLAGLAVKVTTNFFLIGLSAVESDMQRNIQILKERSWFDVPVVYNNGRRAILAVEKGTPGERAFADAFAAWKQ